MLAISEPTAIKPATAAPTGPPIVPNATRIPTVVDAPVAAMEEICCVESCPTPRLAKPECAATPMQRKTEEVEETYIHCLLPRSGMTTTAATNPIANHGRILAKLEVNCAFAADCPVYTSWPFAPTV